jgi:hypothetical protein
LAHHAGHTGEPADRRVRSIKQKHQALIERTISQFINVSVHF